MTQQEVEERLGAACVVLYCSDEKALVDSQAHERTIVHYLAYYLRPLFNGWNVDPEYNREGNETDPKRDQFRNLLRPDIIIHRRGVKEGPNLVAIQVKGFWNGEAREKDEEDLRSLSLVYGYQFLYRIELGPKSYEIFRVDPANAR